jgi:L-cysteine:1D-myo-inositol 2-amino-2-deoxy-alpha-D-glucopyranoside ligase
MRFYDTALRAMIDFDPPAGRPVKLYVCGITPYDAAHMGHIFTFLTYDLLQRRLEDHGHAVRLVRNVTDVDEPIFKRAAETGEDYRVLAGRETRRLQSVLSRMHFRQAFAEPLASEYVSQMAQAVARLIEKGEAYKLGRDVYFDISKFTGFGKFSGFSDRLQLAFMADRGGDPERPGKRQPLDFLLWRGIGNRRDPAAWDSPLGRGRPGWHIECSIMSSELLGMPLDIHGGGMDLIFPHHESEIAQSESLGAPPFSRHWMHVAPLFYHGEKMSKSLGNLVFAHDLLKKYSPAVIRLALMHYHYRTGGEWQDGYLGHAVSIARLLQKAAEHPNSADLQIFLARIRCALDDDLDMPQVLHILHEMSASVLASDEPNTTGHRTLVQIYRLLGLVGEDSTKVQLL